MGRIVIETIGGLSAAGSLFVVATGLTLVFGAMRVINLAHGSFYMYGAFLVSTFVGTTTGLRFFWAVALAAIIVSLLGMVVDFTVVRFTVNRDPLTQLLATFGVFLILADLGQHFWGTGFRAVPLASVLTGKVTISGATFPVFDLLITGIAILVGVALWLILRHSVFGWRVRAAVDDPELLQASGVDLRRLQMGVFALGALLAGLGGAIVAPQTVVAPGIDESIIVAAFLVTVIGGLGSVLGTALGALIIAFAQTVGAVVAPTWASTFTFLAAIIVLAVRPSGLLGVPER